MWRGFKEIWTCTNLQLINMDYFFKSDTPLLYLKYLLLSLITKLPYRYYVRVSTYPFSLFVSEYLFLFQWLSCDLAYLFIIFVSKHLFIFQCPSYVCAYLFIIFVFKHIFGFVQWLSSPQRNIFWWNLFSNTLMFLFNWGLLFYMIRQIRILRKRLIHLN